MSDRIGQQLGKYQLLNLIGKGSFAEVYLGEHLHLSTRAAIKVLHTQLTNEDREHFYTEARTMARLAHLSGTAPIAWQTASAVKGPVGLAGRDGSCAAGS